MKLGVAIAVAGDAVAALGAGASTAPASHCSTLKATLTGPPLNGVTPRGRADWKGTPACTGIELKAEVRDVNLPDGTLATLETCGLSMTRTISSREVRFELKTTAICTVGSPIDVRVGTTTVASGTWCNPLFARCD